MNADHQPLAIHLHLQSKSKNFNLKFKATRFLPACYRVVQFSVFLKISSLIILVSSDNNHTIRRKSLKSKITRFIEKVRSIPTKRRKLTDQNFSRFKKLKSAASCEGPVFASTVVIGNLALLIKSISEKDVKGMIVHCLSILLYFLTLLKTSIRTKSNKFLLVSVLAMVGYALWLYVKSNQGHERRAFAWKYIRKTWYTLQSYR